MPQVDGRKTVQRRAREVRIGDGYVNIAVIIIYYLMFSDIYYLTSGGTYAHMHQQVSLKLVL